MKKTLMWLIAIAIIAMVFMSGMFWIFYTFPIAFFIFAVLYYIGKSAWRRIQSKRRR